MALTSTGQGILGLGISEVLQSERKLRPAHLGASRYCSELKGPQLQRILHQHLCSVLRFTTTVMPHSIWTRCQFSLSVRSSVADLQNIKLWMLIHAMSPGSHQSTTIAVSHRPVSLPPQLPTAYTDSSLLQPYFSSVPLLSLRISSGHPQLLNHPRTSADTTHLAAHLNPVFHLVVHSSAALAREALG